MNLCEIPRVKRKAVWGEGGKTANLHLTSRDANYSTKTEAKPDVFITFISTVHALLHACKA